MSRDGVCYVAFGENYVRQCAQATHTVRKHAPELHITVCVDGMYSGVKFADEVDLFAPPAPSQEDNRLWKTRVAMWSPYERTLVLDTDTAVRDPRFVEAFDWLDNYDVMFGPHWCQPTLTTLHSPPIGLYERAAWMFDIKPPVNIYKGGCWLFKKNERSAAFLRRWEDYWIKFGRGRDMPPLLAAVKHSQERDGLQVGELTLEYEHHDPAWIVHSASGRTHPDVLQVPKFKPEPPPPLEKSQRHIWKDVPK